MQRFITTGLLAVCASAVKLHQDAAAEPAADAPAADVPAAGPPAKGPPADGAPAAGAPAVKEEVPADPVKAMVDHVAKLIGENTNAGPDGHVAYEEFMKVVPSFPATEWARIDPGGDGADVNEVRKIAALIGEDPVAQEVFQFFKSHDKNSDWLLAKDELEKPFQAHFDEADLDKNGLLDINEAITWYHGTWSSAIHLHHLVDGAEAPDVGAEKVIEEVVAATVPQEQPADLGTLAVAALLGGQ